MRPPFSGKPSPLGGPHYPLSIGEWLLPLISLGSDRGQPQVKALPIAKSLLRSSAPPLGYPKHPHSPSGNGKPADGVFGPRAGMWIAGAGRGLGARLMVGECVDSGTPLIGHGAGDAGVGLGSLLPAGRAGTELVLAAGGLIGPQ